jgi:nickel/cobalt transporter (NicO) family protein
VHLSSIPFLLVAAGTVGFLHSILPDHWVPLAVVARTQRWTIARTARTSLLASVGHVLTSIILAGVIAIVGLQFRQTFETQQGHIVGVILIATGIGFFVWSFLDGRHHDHDDHVFIPGEGTLDAKGHVLAAERPSAGGRLAAIVVPFGAAASPDLTVLPVALAASGIGLGAVGGVLVTFSAVTLGTFVVMTVGATVAGYQVKGEWLEDHGMLITAAVLAVIGVAVFAGL